MSDVSALLQQAATLGRAVASHPAAAGYLAARDAVSRDTDSQRLLSDYQRHIEHLHGLESEGRPIEVADKRRLAELQSAMASNDALKSLMRTQADYVALMEQVYRAIEEPLNASRPAS